MKEIPTLDMRGDFFVMPENVIPTVGGICSAIVLPPGFGMNAERQA